ncbi:MAG: V-type ATP synthase subunit E [Oscillospiraceae bacterium]|nr:V-type ATP synthase subunit E [Oscillospiraceae bacterium]
MNGIEKITKQIASEAETEIASVLAEAENTAAGLTEKYAAEAKAAGEELLRAGRESADQRVQRQERTARLEARKDILGLKQQLVSAAYDKAKEAILALDTDKYVAFLAKQACAAALTGSEEVILSGKDRAALGGKIIAAANAALAERGLPGELRLSDETRPISGGLVLRRGSIEVNCTLDKLLEMSRGSLDAEVASVLFG